jgi:hypothetical protein
MESDCATLLKWVTGDDEAPNSYLGNVIVGIQTLRKCFVHCNFSFTKREGNRVAHILAQHALHGPNRVWLEEVPSVVTHQVFHYKKYNFLQQFFLLQVAGKIIQGNFTSDLQQLLI